MDKVMKRRWLKALRNDKYKQTTGTLCRGEGENREYCCLGVLCDLYKTTELGKKARAKWVENGDTDLIGFRLSSTVFTRMPSVSIRKNLGLLSKEADTLADMNDCGKSFKQIANYIEKHL